MTRLHACRTSQRSVVAFSGRNRTIWIAWRRSGGVGWCRLSRRGRGELLSSTTYSASPSHTNHIEPRALRYPHKASRTPRKHPIALRHLPLPPRVRPTARVRVRRASGRGAFDVVVEALDDVAGARLFEVGGFVAEDLVFESGHVLVQQALLLQRFPQVALELLVVWDTAGVVRLGDVLGHDGVWTVSSSSGYGGVSDRLEPVSTQ